MWIKSTNWCKFPYSGNPEASHSPALHRKRPESGIIIRCGRDPKHPVVGFIYRVFCFRVSSTADGRMIENMST
ncbi:hypothetical protein MNQ98_15115 [Paenibacillus sp. N3/727]|uniref:hypothetical protein n=1 Tax=Paenibacillus sp. N3/727 TaxID=2925845 RepID=UPI001F532DAA|nr:hypothetical protein [Paenibacillus sp. N3/727]UNK15888.1 hypothetical protein MNQ98_15115 [Paenibacillus sp. N3/727]